MSNMTNGDMNYMFEPVCIITDKVFDQCRQDICIPDVEATIDGAFQDITFRPGFIVEGSLVVTDLEDPNRPDDRRVQFTVRIPYTVETDAGIEEEFLPDIFKDIILYIPPARDEFDFRIIVETQSVVIPNSVRVTNGTLIFAVGIRIIVKVVGRVQLLIPEIDFCPLPPICEEFLPNGDFCDDFEQFFGDFFPPQQMNG